VKARDPVEVMYAFHVTQLQMRVEFEGDFEAALKLEEVRKKGLQLPAFRSGLLENLFYGDVTGSQTVHFGPVKVSGEQSRVALSRPADEEGSSRGGLNGSAET
jgi:hypothetical protein